MKHLKRFKNIESNDIEKAIEIIKSYGVDVDYDDTGLSGSADLKAGIIYIDPTEEDTEESISTLFHELGHFYCYDLKIFKAYHKDYNKNITEKEFKSILRTAIRAERFVDKWAKKKMKEYFPHLRYKSAYTGESTKQWLLNYYYVGCEDSIINMATKKLIKIMSDDEASKKV